MGQVLISKLLFQPPVSRFPLNPDHLYLHSKSGTRLQVLFINSNAKYTMIFSHGNAEDIYLVQSWLQSYFLKQVNVNAVVYEYTGYGEANETIPQDKSLYDDIETVYLYLTENLNISSDNIILFGRSIGSGPSCYLAEKYKVAGIMLHAPLMSALRVVFSNLRWTFWFDKFPNIDRVKNFDCPIYIVHGQRDEIVHICHAHRLWENCVNKDFPPYFVELAGHNNIEKYAKDYLPRVKRFIDHVDKWVQDKNIALQQNALVQQQSEMEYEKYEYQRHEKLLQQIHQQNIQNKSIDS